MGLRFRVQGAGSTAQGFRFKLQSYVLGLGFRVLKPKPQAYSP